jgi:hypothetical protein
VNRRVFIKRALPAIILIATVAAAQSGRSWMNGIVFDESDTNGIAGATVELVGDRDSARLRSVKLTTQTDSNGKYSFKDIPYGDYTFRVSAPGFTPYQIKLYIASDALTELHVKLKKQK